MTLPPPPHKRPRLPVGNSSDDERKSSAVLLLPDEGEGDKENCRPAPLALLLDYIMSKFPVASRPLARPSIRLPDNILSDHGRNSSAVSCNRTNRRAMRRILSLPPSRCWLTTLSASFPAASKPLARLSNKLPDENSSDHGRNSSAGLLQLDEQDGDEDDYLPASLALLLDYIMSKFLVAIKPLAQPSTRRFMSLGLRSFVQESSQRSSMSPGLTMFNSPVHLLSRNLSRDSMRGNRFPRLCPQSQRS